ncbi:MAG TPA: Xaa-Pro aminopeptidase [Thermoanaerobaculia bacterium]|nr:Xaa-Pro aminopeptidase [Thermoanaerobaculia bacterium]
MVRTILIALAASAALAAPPARTLPAEQGREVQSLPGVLAQRARVEPVNRMLRDRLDNLLPRLMREAGIDMWLLINREYAEDPVYLTLVPEPVFAARRTTMLVIHDPGEGKELERLTVSRYGLGGMYEPAWGGGTDQEQWARLAAVIAERNPRRIGINVSEHWAFGDGLSRSLHDRLVAALPPELRSRLVSAENLAIRWLETRTALELEAYPGIVALARGVVSEAFSNRVITPGVTTTDDVAWYIRQRFDDLGLPIWFMPDVNYQRFGEPVGLDEPFFSKEGIIHRGDVLHTDVGITYLRMNTDTQEMGYVLRLGENDVPEGLKRALAAGNRWQDILTSNFVTGRTGNQTLAATRAAAEAEGIVSSTYTHPLGFFGHAPGPTIGMWDNQGPTPIRGDWKLYPNTAYAIEGNVKVSVPEWDDQWVQIKLEQSAVFDGSKVWYLAGRQTRWHIVH